ALRLRPGDPAEIGARMRELAERRAASQPLDRPSAGSTFKRPATGYAAALIEQAGLKGCRIGGAQVSEKHAGFVINAGGASSADILALMEHIQETVEMRFGVRLEPEVRVLG
ncbi:MAG: UDP-N-acetylenolpyruvoylglucosamine reductase, partial [Oscillospiraceae bacterium]|nr:UDP-N-acetylenolpyruvoylglucosamine reductase [Oscillospiraceae bacterium]